MLVGIPLAHALLNELAIIFLCYQFMVVILHGIFPNNLKITRVIHLYEGDSCAVVAKNVGHVGHCRRQDPNVRWVLCKHQTICPTAQAKTWLLKYLQSQKNCQCTSSILLNEVCYFPLWVTGVLYEKKRSKPCFNRWAKMGVIGSHGHKRYSYTVQISSHSGHYLSFVSIKFLP